VSQLQQLQDVLYSAWDAMGCTEYTAERAALAPLLDGPERLHASTKHMVRASVHSATHEHVRMRMCALFKCVMRIVTAPLTGSAPSAGYQPGLLLRSVCWGSIPLALTLRGSPGTKRSRKLERVCLRVPLPNR